MKDMKFLLKYKQLFEAQKRDTTSDKLYNEYIANDPAAKSAYEDLEALSSEENKSGTISALVYTKRPFTLYDDGKGLRISFSRTVTSSDSIISKNEDGSWTLRTETRTKLPISINESEEDITVDKVLSDMGSEKDVSYFFKFDKEKVKKYLDPKTGKEKHYGEFKVKVTFSDGDSKFGDELFNKLGLTENMSGLAKAMRFLWSFAIAAQRGRYLDQSILFKNLLSPDGIESYWGKKIPRGERYGNLEDIEEIKIKSLSSMTDEEKRQLGFKNLYEELLSIPEIAGFLKKSYEKLGLKTDIIKGNYSSGNRTRGSEANIDGDYSIGININPIFNIDKKSPMSAAIDAYNMDSNDINLNKEDFQKKLSEVHSKNIEAIMKKKDLIDGIKVQLSKRDTFVIGDRGKIYRTDPSKPEVYFVAFSQEDALDKLLKRGKNGRESIMYDIFKSGSSNKRLVIDGERVSAAYVYNLILDFTEKISMSISKNAIPSGDEANSIIDEAIKYAIGKSKQRNIIERILSIINPNLSKELKTGYNQERIDKIKNDLVDAQEEYDDVEETPEVKPNQTTKSEINPTQSTPPSEEDDDDDLKSLLL